MADATPVRDAPSRSGGKIAVGCKLPHGLVIQPERLDEVRGVDGAVHRAYVPHGEPVTLAGANSSNVIGGYGITENVDADMFNAWMDSHKSYTPVVQGLIFAQPTANSAKDQAKDQADVKSGFEGLDPNKPGAKLAPASND
jgi:hypothetical protein